MPQESLSSLAAGIMTRLGQLTVQATKQARIQAERATRKSLTEVSKLLDNAINATSVEAAAAAKTKDVKKNKPTAKAKTSTKAESKPKAKAVTASKGKKGKRGKKKRSA